MDLFSGLKFLIALSLPPASLVLGTIVGLVLAILHLPRLGRLVMALAVAETILLSFPPFADTLLNHLEDEARAAARASPRCCFDAIAILGGGIAPALPPDRPDPALNDGADRMWQAARLYHRGVAPRIIVSGGGYMSENGGPAKTEAEAMRRFLVDLGVPADAIVSEGESNNTRENIREIKKIVNDGRVALVTSAYHMPRALQLADRAKLNVSAFPTSFKLIRGQRLAWEDWLPSLEALSNATLALHEILAITFDRRGEASR